MDFSERLKSLRIEKNFTQADFAKSVGMSLRAYQYYETGAQEPTLSKLIALADFFGVSIDYLVGRTNNPDVNK